MASGLGHSDRHAGLNGYCAGLILPGERKSVEPMAARIDLLHAARGTGRWSFLKTALSFR